jgi:hypothetical protein
MIIASGLLLAQAGGAHASLNVTNFGARGDLLTLTNVSVVSNSPVLLCASANFTAADTNKLVEIFNAGTFRSVSNETLIAAITAVTSSSNITVSLPAGRTASGLYGVYGTDNRPAFSNAVAACAVPLDTIFIPAGNYLLIDTNIDGWLHNGEWHAGVILFRGGITFEGQGQVTLTGQGGWKNDSANRGYRGALFQMLSPMTNDYPLVWKNLTLDGGTHGFIENQDFPIHPYDGEGWDTTHHAIAYWQTTASVVLTSTNIFMDCAFRGWRGEMIISGLDIKGGFMTASNCVFSDGNATALNMNMAHDWNRCTFLDMRQIEEFYRDYTTNASSFRNCAITNILGGVAIALNGSYYGCPTYTISNNIYSVTNINATFLLTTPACNVVVANNLIYGGFSGFNLGAGGYQCSFDVCNSNIVIMGNTVIGTFRGFQVQGAGINHVRDVRVASNYFENVQTVAVGYGWSTNVVFSNNVLVGSLFSDQSGLRGQYYLDENNNYSAYDYGWKTGTNAITYERGSLGKTGWNPQTFYLADNAAKIPPGATLTVTNYMARQSYLIYLNSSQTGVPVTLATHAALTFYWTGSAWSTNPPVSAYVLKVNSGSGSGTYASGATVTVTAAPISGKRFTYWSGATNLMLNPFATNTTLIMPAGNAAITANYANKLLAPPANLRPLQNTN